MVVNQTLFKAFWYVVSNSRDSVLPLFQTPWKTRSTAKYTVNPSRCWKTVTGRGGGFVLLALSAFFPFFVFFLSPHPGGPPPPPPLVDPPLVVEQFLECLLYLSITYYVDIRVIKSLSETTRLAFSLASRDVLTILIARPRLQTLKIRKSLYKRRSLLL